MGSQKKKKKEKKIHSLIDSSSGGGWTAGKLYGLNQRIKTLLLIIAILLLTIAVYSNSINNGFVNWDDDKNVYENYAIRDFSKESLKSWVTKPLIGMYTPLVYASYALDYKIAGLSPWMYHLTNLLLHLINVGLVMLIVWKLSNRLFIAGLTALLFAIHPLNFEAVAPVSTRGIMLYSMFFLLAYNAYIKYIRSEYSSKYLVLAFGLFLLSVLSKSAAVVFPLLCLATDYFLERKWRWKLLIEKVPFFVVALVFGVLTIFFREDAGHLWIPYDYTFTDRAILVLHSIFFYFQKALLPIALSAFYFLPEKQNGMLPLIMYLSLPAMMALFWGVYKSMRHSRLVLFCTMFFLINIVLTLRYVPWGFEYADNRYFYLPSIGLLFCLASGIDRLRIAMSSQPLARNALMYGIAASFIVCFTIISFSRTGIWKNSISLWDDVLKKSSQSKVTGVAYLYRGLAKMDEQDYLEAIKDFSEVMRLQPLNPYAYFDRAAARSYLGDYAGAIEDSNRALELDPKAVQAYINRAAAKAFLKDYRGAMADYERVLEIDPNNYEIYRGRCLLRSEARDISGAIADCEKATQLNSYGDKARAILCSLRFESGDISGAVSDCAKLVLLRPTDAKAIANLGNAQAMSGMCSDAIGTLSAAIGLGNSDKNIFYNRALCRIRLGDRQGACSDWKESAIQGDRESAGLVGKYCK